MGCIFICTNIEITLGIRQNGNRHFETVLGFMHAKEPKNRPLFHELARKSRVVIIQIQLNHRKIERNGNEHRNAKWDTDTI